MTDEEGRAQRAYLAYLRDALAEAHADLERYRTSPPPGMPEREVASHVRFLEVRLTNIQREMLELGVDEAELGERPSSEPYI